MNESQKLSKDHLANHQTLNLGLNTVSVFHDDNTGELSCRMVVSWKCF